MLIFLPDKEAQVRRLTLRVRQVRSVRVEAARVFSTLGKRMRSISPPRERRGGIPSFEQRLSTASEA